MAIKDEVEEIRKPTVIYSEADFHLIDTELATLVTGKTEYDLAVKRGLMSRVPNGSGYIYQPIAKHDGFDHTLNDFLQFRELWSQYERWKYKQEKRAKKLAQEREILSHWIS